MKGVWTKSKMRRYPKTGPSPSVIARSFGEAVLEATIPLAIGICIGYLLWSGDNTSVQVIKNIELDQCQAWCVEK